MLHGAKSGNALTQSRFYFIMQLKGGQLLYHWSARHGHTVFVSLKCVVHQYQRM